MKRFMMAMAVAVICSNRLDAQEACLTYTTELQGGFPSGINWVNLLRTDLSLPAGRHVEFQTATISIAKTMEGRLLDDLQTFSNIEEDNLPLAIAVAGIRWKSHGFSIFAGIRNINEDYFTSGCTSLFTNSSCGIFPTLSANFPLANYPMSAVCADCMFTTGKWEFRCSLYNGTAHNSFYGRDNVFRFCPAADGLTGISSASLDHEGSIFNAGIAVNSRERLQNVRTAFWIYAEQRISPAVYLLLQYSASPGAGQVCRRFAGAGVVARYSKLEFGLHADWADFRPEHECALELTCRINCREQLRIQPAVHIISRESRLSAAGLIRLYIEVGTTWRSPDRKDGLR